MVKITQLDSEDLLTMAEEFPHSIENLRFVSPNPILANTYVLTTCSATLYVYSHISCSQSPFETGTIIIPTTQMRKLRLG